MIFLTMCHVQNALLTSMKKNRTILHKFYKVILLLENRMRYLAKYLIYATALAGLAWGGATLMQDLKGDLSRLETIIEQRSNQINTIEKELKKYMQPTDKKENHTYR